MTIHTQVKTALRNVVVKGLAEFPNVPVIFAYQSGSEPPATYCTIYLLRVEQQGRKMVSTLADTQRHTSFDAAYEVQAQFSFFGSNSGDAAYSLSQRLSNSPFLLEELSKNKLGYMRKTQVRNNPQRRETQWIESFNFDVHFSYVVSTKELVDTVAQVTIRDNFSSQQTSIPPEPLP